MIEGDNGMPKLGTTAETLGIRRGKDIVPDQGGMVLRPNFQAGCANGLSCAPIIFDLPRFALPRIWGGSNKRTVIWCIEASDLGPDLVAVEDSDPARPRRHLSIGPARPMHFDEFARLIEATRPNWK